MGKLDGKVALITGGNSGIGLTATKLFLAEGAKVAITGRNQTTLDSVAEELGSNVLAIQADASDPASMVHAVSQIITAFNRLDIVYANAGIASATPLGSTEFSVFEEVLKINVTGVFFTVQAALHHLKEGASIILTGSTRATDGAQGRSAYAASKGAISSMARVMVSELSPRGIRVNTVVPGATRTAIWNKATPEETAKLVDSQARSIPLNRMGDPVEIANVALFLASDESSFVQGAEITVDGGARSAPLGAPIYR
ncbi:SDR family oxidoreductase [Paenibacillus qinlingensis]|uniref:NAD(P)-dependent dehydrogenase (Short-subunit alcohol dehydrogenase family) n=1 Tax=Paenibacillus qinlingensis TaxID=1837343 RepID=A0ABU1NRQ0_9BACL|nr:SDR family oxidoreductase [Paenibacillus qinlingensis]MDR6550158.1 NAD(P)-dependent dehydrogenase (short-subunit alcohol dehydrogenase family) [Paenibacillus qinlingensis]